MEKSLPPDELARRLTETLSSLSGDIPVEEFVESARGDGLEGVSNKQVRNAKNAATELRRGKTPSTEGMYHLEAIVHRKHRPSHLVVNNKFDAFAGEFRYLSTDRKVRKRVEAAFPAVGRIDVTELGRYEGTGFVVGKNLVMTNRHVAQIFTEGVGRRRVRIKPWGSEVDFAEAPSPSEAEGYELVEPVMVHPYWDVALFRADLPDITPLKLSTKTYETLLKDEQDIVAIGYPARDSRNGKRAQREIFGDEFEVKRIAPGRITRRKRKISSRWLRSPVAALAHDASTLGGNSGSAILNVKDGTVEALHFAGRYMLENYGVPGYELARDPRIVDAGVKFAGKQPPQNNDLNNFWDDVESPPVVSSPRQSQHSGNYLMSHDQDEITVEVPLRIRISLGRPVVGSQDTYPQSDDDRDASGVYDDPSDPDDDLDHDADVETGESTGSGYDPEFLSESVPIPRLPKKIANDTFELNGEPLINYTHFSVCQSKSRRLPRFVAWNIDGGALKQLSRKGIPFIIDRRIPRKFQAGNELYKSNDYDRGHVARRADLNWGPIREAKRANRDSFFFTNMTPQHEEFNQSSKGGPADCDRWRRHLEQSLATSTIEKILKRAKTMFRHAVRDRILKENPFEDLRIGSTVNRERDAFISGTMATTVLKACPNTDWKLIFALARYGGLRTPSETLSLRWSDVEWEEGRFRIDSPKTGLRWCPLFPELRSVLEQARKGIEKREHVVGGDRGTGRNLRTQLNRIVENAGLEPWPKTFVNLRASRRTELQEEFPDHVINSWLGHSGKIAEKHYLQVTDDHWDRAIGGNAGGNISTDQQESGRPQGAKKHGNQAPEWAGFPLIEALAPPRGLEPLT